jgi:hypothetical protein
VTDRASPDIEHLITSAIESYVDNVHVSLPGIVVSYDAAKQTATVKPAVKRPVMNEDDQIVYEEYAPISNVPVQFPGAASLSFHFALAAGDTVKLVWQDFSIATWRKTGKVSEAGDTRKHGPSYPIAEPWMRPNGGPGPDTDESIGKPGGLRLVFTDTAVAVGTGTDFVAMALKVDAGFAALQATLATFAGTQATASTGPLAALQPGYSALATAIAVPVPPTASSNLKAD